jgi:hypothetical protein
VAESKDPLESLLLDAAEVDRARLAAALRDSVGVDTKTGGIVLKPGFNNLTSRQKVIAYLLGRKAAHLLQKNDGEAATVTTLQKETGMPVGTIGPYLRQLLKDKVISQTASKEYYLENHQLSHAIAEMTKGA